MSDALKIMSSWVWLASLSPRFKATHLKRRPMPAVAETHALYFLRVSMPLTLGASTTHQTFTSGLATTWAYPYPKGPRRAGGAASAVVGLQRLAESCDAPSSFLRACSGSISFLLRILHSIPIPHGHPVSRLDRYKR